MSASLRSLPASTVFDPMTVDAMMHAYLMAKRLLHERGVRVDDEVVAQSIMHHAQEVTGSNEVLVQRVVKSVLSSSPESQRIGANFANP